MSLSMTCRKLKVLDVSGNLVSSTQGHRSVLAQLIPTLKELNGSKVGHRNSKLSYSLTHRSNNTGPSETEGSKYSELYDDTIHSSRRYSTGGIETMPTLFSLAKSPIEPFRSPSSLSSNRDSRSMRDTSYISISRQSIAQNVSIESSQMNGNSNNKSKPTISPTKDDNHVNGTSGNYMIRGNLHPSQEIADAFEEFDGSSSSVNITSTGNPVLDSLPWRKQPSIIPRPRRPFPAKSLSKGSRDMRNSQADDKDDEDSVEDPSISALSLNALVQTQNKQGNYLIPTKSGKKRVMQRAAWISPRLSLTEQQQRLHVSMLHQSTEEAVAEGRSMALRSGSDDEMSSRNPQHYIASSPTSAITFTSSSKFRPSTSLIGNGSESQDPRQRTKASILRDNYIKDKIEEQTLATIHEQQKQVHRSDKKRSPVKESQYDVRRNMFGSDQDGIESTQTAIDALLRSTNDPDSSIDVDRPMSHENGLNESPGKLSAYAMLRKMQNDINQSVAASPKRSIESYSSPMKFPSNSYAKQSQIDDKSLENIVNMYLPSDHSNPSPYRYPQTDSNDTSFSSDINNQSNQSKGTTNRSMDSWNDENQDHETSMGRSESLQLSEALITLMQRKQETLRLLNLAKGESAALNSAI